MDRSFSTYLNYWKNNLSKPLVLLGARQVGKSYLLKEFGRKSFQNLHYFDFEKQPQLHEIFKDDLSPQKVLIKLEIETNSQIDVTNDLVVFDEIQVCPRALTSLKYFCEDLPKLKLVAAGSLLGLNFGEGSFPVGKVELAHMYPMSFAEFLLAMGEDKFLGYLNSLDGKENAISESLHKKAWDLLKQYFVVGGFPEVVEKYSKKVGGNVSLEAFDMARHIQSQIEKMFLADMAKHCGHLNSKHLARVFTSAANQLSQSVDGSVDKFKFKNVLPGVRGYDRLSSSIDWLLAASLLTKIEIAQLAQSPLSAYTKENFFKLYFVDVGLLGAVTNLTPQSLFQFQFGTYKGFYAENFVLQELLSSGFQKLFCWREGESEIEFLCDHNRSGLTPIEVKSGHKLRSKSLTMFTQKYQPKKRVLLTADEFRVEPDFIRLPLYLSFRLNEFLVV